MPTQSLYNAIERLVWQDLNNPSNSGKLATWLSNQYKNIKGHKKLETAVNVVGRLPGSKFILGQAVKQYKNRQSKKALLTQKGATQTKALKASQSLGGLVSSIHYEYSVLCQVLKNWPKETPTTCDTSVKVIIEALELYQSQQNISKNLKNLEEFLLAVDGLVEKEMATLEKSYNTLKRSCDGVFRNHSECNPNDCHGSDKGGDSTIDHAALGKIQSQYFNKVYGPISLPDWANVIGFTFINTNNFKRDPNGNLPSLKAELELMGVELWKKASDIGLRHKRTGVTNTVDQSVSNHWNTINRFFYQKIDLHFLGKNNKIVYSSAQKQALVKEIISSLNSRSQAAQSLILPVSAWLKAKEESESSKRMPFINQLRKCVEAEVKALNVAIIKLNEIK